MKISPISYSLMMRLQERHLYLFHTLVGLETNDPLADHIKTEIEFLTDLHSILSGKKDQP